MRTHSENSHVIQGLNQTWKRRVLDQQKYLLLLSRLLGLRLGVGNFKNQKFSTNRFFENILIYINP